MGWTQLDQPKQLEELAKNEVSQWIFSQQETLVDVLEDFSDEDLAANFDKNLTHQIKIHQDYFKNLPPMLRTQLLKNLFEKPNHVMYIYDKIRFGYEKIIANRILEIFFMEKLTVLALNLEEMDRYGNFFCAKAFMLTGLTDLKLDIPQSRVEYVAGCIEPGDMEQKIIDILKQLKNLKYLSISCCTDNIISYIVENCKSVENLELRLHNLNLNNDIINKLTQMPNVKRIDLVDLSINMHTNSAYLRNENNKMKVLEQVKLNKLFYLKSYINYGAWTMKQLKMVADNFSYLRSLAFHTTSYNESLENFLPALENLDNLQHLDIRGYAFYTGQVKELLTTIGSKVTDVRFSNIKEFDINALSHLQKMCPFLEELTMIFCTLPNTASDDMSAFVDTDGKFEHLRRFEWDSSYHSEEFVPSIKFVLSKSPNIEKIIINESHFSDETMSYVLERNCLRHLTEITLNNELPTTILDQIITKCHSPKIMIN